MIFTISAVTISVYLIYIFNKKNKKVEETWQLPKTTFPNSSKIILQKHVLFYNSLNTEEKAKFEYKVQEFLLNYKIIAVNTTINIEDKLLVAASAIIPIFGFNNWRYTNLHQVLIYPTMFNENFEIKGDNRRILGMVGNGYMEGTMILSKEALHHGFKNESDKKNTAIHEFVHLIDKTGGTIDGIPCALLEKQYTIPWIDLMNKKLDEIYDGDSDINPYGGTNRAEFFSVVSEYFFERPKLLERKHPELYNHLENIFNQDMAERDLKSVKTNIKRNSLCPCNSGEKYKNCCLVN